MNARDNARNYLTDLKLTAIERAKKHVSFIEKNCKAIYEKVFARKSTTITMWNMALTKKWITSLYIYPTR